MRHILRVLAAALLWSTTAAAEPASIEHVRTQLIAGQDAAAADTLIAVAKRGHDAIAPLPSELWRELYRRLSRANDTDRTLALDLALLGAHFDAGFGADGLNGFAARSVLGLTEHGRLTQARALLAQVQEPQSLSQMLVDRRYAAMWPAIEARANPDFTAIEANWIGITARESAAEPQNFRRLTALGAALRGAGRRAELIALVEPLTGSPDRAAARLGLAPGAVALDDYGWAVNEYAYAFAHSGRAPEADRVFADLVDMGMERAPQLVGMIINRAELLLAAGRFDNALNALAAAEPLDRTASVYGQMWAWRIRVCALHALGRDAQAADPLARMAAAKADNWSAYTAAMLCLDRPDAVETALLACLADERFRAEALAEVQDTQTPARLPFEAVLHARLAAVVARPTVATAIERWGRLLPPALRRTSTD